MSVYNYSFEYVRSTRVWVDRSNRSLDEFIKCGHFNNQFVDDSDKHLFDLPYEIYIYCAGRKIVNNCPILSMIVEYRPDSNIPLSFILLFKNNASVNRVKYYIKKYINPIIEEGEYPFSVSSDFIITGDGIEVVYKYDLVKVRELTINKII